MAGGGLNLGKNVNVITPLLRNYCFAGK